MHKWLLEKGMPSLPAEYHESARKVASEVMATFPYKRINGLSNLPEYTYSILYRATPLTWLTDAAIQACCERLASDFIGCRFAGFQSAQLRTKRMHNSEETPVDAHVRDRILEQVDTVLLPLNFMNFHWCCIVVKAHAKRIFFYDPLNQGPYMKAAQAIATQLKLVDYATTKLFRRITPSNLMGIAVE
ncbi:hypothetical protein L914_08730, partial [Phytophthora nicotianae]